MPVWAIPRLARALGVSVEELLGEPISAAANNRGPAPKLQAQLERNQQAAEAGRLTRARSSRLHSPPPEMGSPQSTRSYSRSDTVVDSRRLFTSSDTIKVIGHLATLLKM
jgi:hypothetical protein